jgi:hypothetical protein
LKHLPSPSGEEEACRLFAVSLAGAFENHVGLVTETFVQLAENRPFLTFAREQFCGLAPESLIPHPDFLTLWADFSQALLRLVEACIRGDDSGLQSSALILVAESFVNGLLARLTVDDDPQVCWGAAVAYAGAQGLRFPCGTHVLTLSLLGVILSSEPEADSQLVRGLSKNPHPPPEQTFQWVGPVRCTPLGFLSLSSGFGFFQLLCRGFPECVRKIDLTHFEGAQFELQAVRLLQREVCVLTEEWEFRNAVLAVGFTEARDLLIAQSEKRRHAEANQQLAGINQSRDELALWYCWSLVEAERYLALLCRHISQAFDSALGMTNTGLSRGSEGSVSLIDLSAECSALDAVVSAALQKLFLPASVSRHDYHPEVLLACSQWARVRTERVHDDCAARIAALAFSWGRSVSEFEAGALQLLCTVEDMSTVDWFMSFEPSAALKSFCWSLPGNVHVVICLIYGAMLVRKAPLKSGCFDIHWASVLISIAQMPDTYAALRVRQFDMRGVKADFSTEFQHRCLGLYQRLSALIPPQSDEGEDLLFMWREACSPLFESLPTV